ncbi:amidohydrolase [Catenulispora rubra]|uniref:amidohydrolase n=1 Tax=Catenulispora rubra TaxID=280293 RepID=UPI001892287B|nr:amidohydrolase [Catenulispora rubra]
MSRSPFADLVFTGGPCYTVDAARSWAGAAAVADGRITAVGRHADVKDLIGPGTEVVDLAGKLLLPGFQDAHVHPVLGGTTLRQCDLHELHTAEEFVAAVADYAQRNPHAAWIRGGGWSMDAFPGGMPTKEMLDAVVPDRPVALPNRDVHGMWVNSKALEVCGITRDTPDPFDGRIERDADGEPNGCLQEGAMALVNAHLPVPTAEETTDGLLAGQAYLHSFGITAWQDAWVGDGLGIGDVFETYLDAAVSGALTARVAGALWWERESGLEQLELFRQRREAAEVAGAGRFRARTVKMMLDGVAENHTAALLSPYLDGCGCTTDNAGLDFIDPDKLKTYVTELDAAGFQVHFHALGDRAVRNALDALEAARAANGPGGRHHLAHLQVVHPDDVQRFRRLGATANIQALWAAHEPAMDELTIPFLGEERAGWQYPFGSLSRAGATIAAGSDWSVTSPNPLWGIHTAVNRVEPGLSAQEFAARKVFYPEERLELGQAIAAYTAGSAYVNRLDDVTGSVEVGKLADLVVLDRDPFEGPAWEIGEARVLRTYVEGVEVYAADA